MAAKQVPDRLANSEDPLEIVRALRTTVNEIDRKLIRARWVIRLLTVSLFVDIVVSVVLGFLVVHEHNVSGTLRKSEQEIHQAQLHACRIGNDSRSAQRALWGHVLDLSSGPRPGETPAQRKTRLKTEHDFKIYIDEHFRAVNCAKLYGRSH